MRNRLMVTLWPLNDGEARDFMIAFYHTWLSQAGRSEAKALRDPRVWAPYVLVE